MHFAGNATGPNRRRKQHVRLAEFESSAAADVNGHQFPIAGKIIQLLSVGSPPTWLITTPTRNHLSIAGAGRKRFNVNLNSAGCVRLIGDPTCIWRELALVLTEL